MTVNILIQKLYIVKIMTFSAPLHDNELIDCAKANANQEIEVVSERCGYGKDIATFERELKKACDSIGVEIKSFKDLRDKPESEDEQGIEIAPKTPSKF